MRIGLLLCAVGLLQAQDSIGKTAQTAAVRTGASVLRIAVVQMQSSDRDIEGNLKRATTFADSAAAKGAADPSGDEALYPRQARDDGVGLEPLARELLPEDLGCGERALHWEYGEREFCFKAGPEASFVVSIGYQFRDL